MDIKGLVEPTLWKGQNDHGRGNSNYIGYEVEDGAASWRIKKSFDGE